MIYHLILSNSLLSLLVSKYHKRIQQFDSCLARKMTSLCIKVVWNSKCSSVNLLTLSLQAVSSHKEVVLSPHLLQFCKEQIYMINALLSVHGQCWSLHTEMASCRESLSQLIYIYFYSFCFLWTDRDYCSLRLNLSLLVMCPFYSQMCGLWLYCMSSQFLMATAVCEMPVFYNGDIHICLNE